jgi:hypothetical protein
MGTPGVGEGLSAAARAVRATSGAVARAMNERRPMAEAPLADGEMPGLSAAM